MARIRKPKTPARVVKKRPKPASTLAQASRRLLQVLRRRGWSVRLASGSRKLLPPAVAKRYPQLPEDVETFSVRSSSVSARKIAYGFSRPTTSRGSAARAGAGTTWSA